MEVKELFQHAAALRDYCKNREFCSGCIFDGVVCSEYDDLRPEQWQIPKEYLEEEEEDK